MHDAQDFDIRLSNYARGQADAQLAAHIAGCEACRESVFALLQLMEYRQGTGGRLVDPPESVLAQASGLLARVRPNLITRPEPVTDRLRDKARQLVATLILDTGATPQVTGLRGQADRRTWQLAFVSDVADLDLEVIQVGDLCTVAGQLGMDYVPPGLKIRFIPADQTGMLTERTGVIEADILERGHFAVSLPAADWVASVEIDDAVVLFPGVRL